MQIYEEVRSNNKQKTQDTKEPVIFPSDVTAIM